MALTAAQLAARTGKLTSSRIACLMTGDAKKILQLYNEMIGTAAPEDLSDLWPVRLGEATEALNLEWFERKNGCKLIRHGEVVDHPLLSWACITLDGWYEELQCPVEAKHVGGREPIEVVVERYQPQMQWVMEVTCADQIALSIIQGANAPTVEFIERDVAYAKEMIKRGQQFMDCVRRKVPPVELPPVPPPIDAKAVYDMAGNNQWAAFAGVWLETKKAADLCWDAEKVLKSLVPADGKKVHGHGVQITRDRAGRLSLREAA
jgi:predicted phage-related endonuclease